MKKLITILCMLLILSSLVSCSTGTKEPKSSNSPVAQPTATPDARPDATTPPVDDKQLIKIELKNTTISAGEGVTVNDKVATITKGGTYEISGTLNYGQIIIETDQKVFLILKNASIRCNTSAPIYVKKADHVYLTLEEGTTNTLTDGKTYNLAAGEDEPDAALFSKSDMTISGKGTLNITAQYNDAIASRDALIIESGIINVNAANHGIKGKDFLSILGGDITVIAGNDGIKSTNTSDTALGYVIIDGGNIKITAKDEAISAVTNVNIKSGMTTIITENNAIKAGKTIEISGGTVNIQTEDKSFLCAEQKISSEANVTVNGKKI